MKLPVNLKAELDQWGPIDAYPLYPSFWFWPIARYTKKDYGILWPPLLGIYIKDRLTFIWEKPKMQAKAEAALKQWILNERNFKVARKRYTEVLRRGERLERKMRPVLQGKNISDGEFKNLASLVYTQLFDLWVATLMCELANFGCTDYLNKQLQKYLTPEKISPALEVLLAPESLSFHQQEELERLQIFSGAKSSNELAKRLEAHANKWYWVNNSYHDFKNETAKDFAKTLKNFTKTRANKKIKQILAYTRQNMAKKISLVKKYNLPANILRDARRMSFSILWQDERKGKVWQYDHWVYELTKLAPKKLKIPFSNLLYYTAEEWRTALTSGKALSLNKIRARQKFVTFASGNGQYNLLSNAKLQDQLALVLRWNNTVKTTAITGTVVSKGKSATVSGRVRILLTSKKSNLMKNGEILVAPMTSPDFVPAMRKAKAIITDVGGLMSHAAVISRELNVPCVVGTKTATKVLKNGNTVKVDTTTGEIKIIKN